MLLRLSRSLAVLALIFLLTTQTADAANARGQVVAARDITNTSIDILFKKRSQTKAISCFKTTSGKTSIQKKKLIFTSFKTQLSKANGDLKRAKSAKSRKKIKDNIALLKILRSVGDAACREPAYLSLSRYSGPFGEKQAQRLLEVFALGGKPGQADRYAAIGLDAAVTDLTTLKADPYVDNFRSKLTCGPNPFNTTNPDKCYQDGDINDFYLDGFISGLNWRSINSINPAHMALFEWVMDERAPGNPRVLNGCNRWMFPKYIEMVDRFVNSGDYKNYAQEWVNDSFIHGKWLSGVSNQSGLLKVGNEDFAREFMELFTTGRNKPDGTPVYNDFDVYQASLAMSGLAETRVRNQNDDEVCVIGWFKDLHKAGPKTIFAGTPQQMVVDNASDMANAIFIKQREQIAYELARRLWGRFISSKGTIVSYQRLAKEILAADFKLWPVMMKMMKSKAFYAPESNETILKNPHSLFVTFARMTGVPVESYNQMSDRLDRIGMQLGEPPTVFGFSYQNELLASDIYQLERFNALTGHMIYQNLDNLKERYNWTPHSGLVQGIPLTGNPALDLVNNVLKRLNMADSVNGSQKELLVQFLNYNLSDCYDSKSPECFKLNNEMKRLYRDAPDLGDTENDFYRLRLLYAMVANMPAFGTM